jgi:hypothetical protein
MTERYAEAGHPGRFIALIVADDDREAADARRAIEVAQGETRGRLAWTGAPANIARFNKAVLMLEAEHVDDAVLEEVLPRIDAATNALDLHVVLALGEQQIDIVARQMMSERVQLLCSPSVAERVAALVIAAKCLDHIPVVEKSGESETARLARLNEEVARIAEVLARLTQRDSKPRDLGGNVVADNRLGFDAGAWQDVAIDPADIRRVIRSRRSREQFLGGGLFEDPAWDMLLDLFAAYLERAQVSVSSLCIAAAVAPTTALRWISKLSDAGLFRREPDEFDRRRAFITLSDGALEGMRRYVAAAKRAGLPVV